MYVNVCLCVCIQYTYICMYRGTYIQIHTGSKAACYKSQVNCILEARIIRQELISYMQPLQLGRPRRACTARSKAQQNPMARACMSGIAFADSHCRVMQAYGLFVLLGTTFGLYGINCIHVYTCTSACSCAPVLACGSECDVRAPNFVVELELKGVEH